MSHLHSNMVRFIIIVKPLSSYSAYKFTFQYGQIYYHHSVFYFVFKVFIYIPIWLDLLCFLPLLSFLPLAHLHSNMVRFIIEVIATAETELAKFTFQYGQIYYLCCQFSSLYNFPIYIPIWLDLLLQVECLNDSKLENLHSNMVRFIMFNINSFSLASNSFTFQYGQIYYISLLIYNMQD